jgi:hypothetical protein
MVIWISSDSPFGQGKRCHSPSVGIFSTATIAEMEQDLLLYAPPVTLVNFFEWSELD